MPAQVYLHLSIHYFKMAYKNTLLSILALALAYYFTMNEFLLIASVVVILLSLAFPLFNKIQDFIWKIINNISEFIGNKIILSLIFLIIITPLSFLVKIKVNSRGFIEVDKTQKKEDTIYMG